MNFIKIFIASLIVELESERKELWDYKSTGFQKTDTDFVRLSSLFLGL